jgi:hypothetical protein
MSSPSRIARAMERQKLGLNPSPILRPENMQERFRPPAGAQQVQIPVEVLGQLVPAMLQQGIQPGYAIGYHDTQPMIQVTAQCGPIQIPMAFDLEKTEQLIANLNKVYALVTRREAEKAEQEQANEDVRAQWADDAKAAGERIIKLANDAVLEDLE